MKKLTDIKAYHNDANNCIDDSIVSICNLYNKESVYMYMNALKFHYNRKKKLVGDRIWIKNEVDYDIIEKYCGIQIITYKSEGFESMLKKIACELENGNTCMIHIRCKDFIWDNFYQKKNVPSTFIHKALVVKIDKNYLLCTDGFYGKTNEKLSIENYKKAYVNEIDIFKVKENENTFDYQKELKNTIIHQKELPEKIRSFAKDIKEKSVIQEEIFMDSDKYIYSPLSDNLRIIYRCRKKFKILLEKFYEVTGNKIYKNCIDKIDDSIKKWDYIMILLTKMNITKKDNEMKSVYNYLLEIAKLEEDVIEEICSI